MSNCIILDLKKIWIFVAISIRWRLLILILCIGILITYSFKFQRIVKQNIIRNISNKVCNNLIFSG